MPHHFLLAIPQNEIDYNPDAGVAVQIPGLLAGLGIFCPLVKRNVQNQQFIGIEIGGTKLQIVCGYADGALLSTRRFDVNKEEGAAGIRNTLEAVLKEYKDKQIAAVGVGFGGPVNHITGTIETSFHIEGWSGFALKDWLVSVMNCPVFVENDANVAALGEATHGIGKNYQTVLYVTIGSGVGGGLIVEILPMLLKPLNGERNMVFIPLHWWAVNAGKRQNWQILQ